MTKEDSFEKVLEKFKPMFELEHEVNSYKRMKEDARTILKDFKAQIIKENPLAGLSDVDLTVLNKGYNNAISSTEIEELKGKWKKRLGLIEQEQERRKQLSKEKEAKQ